MTPQLNLPVLKIKYLTVMSNFPSIRSPFYVPSQVFNEGTALKLDPANAGAILMSNSGDGAVTIGLALQTTYSDAAWGALQGYHLPNNTGQRLDGSPIGVLTGQGYAEIRNYSGTLNWGSPIYVGPSGLLVTTGHSWAISGNLLPVVAETSGTSTAVNAATAAAASAATAVRIRFNFKLV